MALIIFGLFLFFLRPLKNMLGANTLLFRYYPTPIATCVLVVSGFFCISGSDLFLHMVVIFWAERLWTHKLGSRDGVSLSYLVKGSLGISTPE
ncbi:unnamed protein product [Meloidogyne enterolobii]|uniref:Uncharacterized protein n=1 Tax=Meloidogyne enterolobii TaxID=390850 RepID=A0ACB0ZDP1_MELEN